jgi:hypothetical protein
VTKKCEHGAIEQDLNAAGIDRRAGAAQEWIVRNHDS